MMSRRILSRTARRLIDAQPQLGPHRILQQGSCIAYCFSTSSSYSSSSNSSSSSSGERLRVAVVGGGVAGLSTALHLAPLVRSGHLSGPIDVYTGGGDHGGGGGGGGRDIGVGVWSTALDPFGSTHEKSHQIVHQDLLKQGCFVRNVGYRTPKGDWLASSRLDGSLSDLLFLRERDLLATLRKAVHLEEHQGTIRLHSNTIVDSIQEDFNDKPWSAPLMLQESSSTSSSTEPKKKRPTEQDYHLIVAADGMNSVIRRRYGGYKCATQGSLMMASGGSPLDTMDDANDNPNVSRPPPTSWYVTGQAEATGVQDREYTVFRGNAPLSMKELGMDKSFQTWGEGKSMRFATVPMLYPTNGTREERQVWFITIDDDTIAQEPDPERRRAKLLEAFSGWHDPIRQLVESTRPEDILVERAMAHKHSMSPVANFNGVLAISQRGNDPNNNNSNTNATHNRHGHGPAIVFVGDAFMTVDPILAQGFTIGMEGAAALRTSLEASLDPPATATAALSSPHKNGGGGGGGVLPRGLAFDPYALRVELKSRHDARLNRLIHLLRATELVQALGQPTTGTFSGMLSRDILRPLMKITPGFIKTPIFNFMLQYSLGVPGAGTKKEESSPW